MAEEVPGTCGAHSKKLQDAAVVPAFGHATKRMRQVDLVELHIFSIRLCNSFFTVT